MRPSMPTMLRRAESRGLAAVLACLMLAVALIGGAHIGAMAADSGAAETAALCSHAGGNGPQPADPRADLCCVAGCLAHAPALDAPPPAVPAPTAAGRFMAVAAATATPVRHRTPGAHPPRGPPSLA
jgi:hypothetical protein